MWQLCLDSFEQLHSTEMISPREKYNDNDNRLKQLRKEYNNGKSFDKL